MPRARRTALALAATLCLTAAPLAAKAGENFERTFELDAGGSVAVANVNGSIAIKAADGSRVVLRAVKTADNADCLENRDDRHRRSAGGRQGPRAADRNEARQTQLALLGRLQRKRRL